jgi:hypothetical protein
MTLTNKYLEDNYVNKRLSAKQISQLAGCSENKVHYWLKKYQIKKRSIQEATYIKSNPLGDPFQYQKPATSTDWFLYGLGMGLYWGEGNKANKHAIRLGNTDPALIKYFLLFLENIYKIDPTRLRFGLQIFTDTEPAKAKAYWCKNLGINSSQFHKTTISKQHKLGSYHKKLPYGVLTVYFSNRKLRDIIVGAIQGLQNDQMPM